LTMRPRCCFDFRSISSRQTFKPARVPSSSLPMRRLYPATSAARMAASRLCTRAISIAPFHDALGSSLWLAVGKSLAGRDVRFGSFASGSGRPPLQPCPLCPESDVQPPKCDRSRWAKSRHSAVRRKTSLLDHLIGGRRRDGGLNANRPGVTSVDRGLWLIEGASHCYACSLRIKKKNMLRIVERPRLEARKKRLTKQQLSLQRRTVLFVHGATYPASTAFDLALDGIRT
jgi:hypothetical protein